MLGIYSLQEPVRIVGIDPGSDTLGVSVLDVHLDTNRIELAFSTTFSGYKMARDYKWLSSTHGDKAARLRAHEENLFSLFSLWQPHEIISESPYYGRFAATFAALTECMTSIRNAVIQYDFRQPLLIIDPASVKSNLDVNGKSSDKELMRQAVLALIARSTLHNSKGIDVKALDEHSIDSIAVAYYRARFVIENNAYTFSPANRR